MLAQNFPKIKCIGPQRFMGGSATQNQLVHGGSAPRSRILLNRIPQPIGYGVAMVRVSKSGWQKSSSSKTSNENFVKESDFFCKRFRTRRIFQDNLFVDPLPKLGLMWEMGGVCMSFSRTGPTPISFSGSVFLAISLSGPSVFYVRLCT